jgi:DNA primase
MSNELFNILWEAGLNPKRSGGSIFICCIYHNETDASLSIKDNRFHCFGCSKSGTLDRLLEDLEIINKPEYDVVQLESERLLTLVTNKLGELEGLPKDYKLFNKSFRGIRKEILNEFECGTSKLYGDGEELLFPIYTEQGNLGGFIRHIINGKYKNTFFNGYLPFNLNRVVSTNLLLVEGIFDLLSVYQAGYKNVLALLGTGNVWKVAQYLKKIKAKNVRILFDGDDPGYAAAKKMHEIYPQSTILELPYGEDPNSIDQDQLERIIRL